MDTYLTVPEASFTAHWYVILAFAVLLVVAFVHNVIDAKTDTLHTVGRYAPLYFVAATAILIALVLVSVYYGVWSTDQVETALAQFYGYPAERVEDGLYIVYGNPAFIIELTQTEPEVYLITTR